MIVEFCERSGENAVDVRECMSKVIKTIGRCFEGLSRGDRRPVAGVHV